MWIIGGAILLIAILAIGEAWLKRNNHRPLSKLAEGRRRHDDPNRPDQHKTHHVVSVKTIEIIRNATEGTRGATRKKHWNVVKDPQKYAKAMMPKPKKGPKK